MTQTDLTLYEGEDWDTAGHVSDARTRECDHEVPRSTIRLRRIGWIDQSRVAVPASVVESIHGSMVFTRDAVPCTNRNTARPQSRWINKLVTW